MNIEKFGEIMDEFLKENEIQMLFTMPKGTLDVEVRDNANLGSVVQFYIVLNSITKICSNMKDAMGIDEGSADWTNTVDALLAMVRAEIIEGSKAVIP